MAYLFERYAIAEELVTISDATALLGVTREAVALMVLRGQLAVVDAVKPHPEDRSPRFLLRAEVDRLVSTGKLDQLPLNTTTEKRPAH